MLLYSPYEALFQKLRNRANNVFLASARNKRTVWDERSSTNATESTTSRQFCLCVLFTSGVKYKYFMLYYVWVVWEIYLSMCIIFANCAKIFSIFIKSDFLLNSMFSFCKYRLSSKFLNLGFLWKIISIEVRIHWRIASIFLIFFFFFFFFFLGMFSQFHHYRFLPLSL